MESIDYGSSNSSSSVALDSPPSIANSLHSEDADYLDDANTLTYRDARNQADSGKDGNVSLGGVCEAEATERDGCSPCSSSELGSWCEADPLEGGDAPPCELACADARMAGEPERWKNLQQRSSVSSLHPSKLVDSLSDEAGDGRRIGWLAEARDGSSNSFRNTIPLSSEARSSTSRWADDAAADVVAKADALESEDERSEGDGDALLERRPSSLALSEPSRELMHSIQEERALQQHWYMNPEEMTDSYIRARWPYRRRSIASSSPAPSSRPSTVQMSLSNAQTKEPLLMGFSPSPQRPEGYRDEEPDGSQRQVNATNPQPPRFPLMSPSVTSDGDAEEGGEAAPSPSRESRGSTEMSARPPAAYEIVVEEGPGRALTTTSSAAPPPCVSAAPALGEGRGGRERGGERHEQRPTEVDATHPRPAYANQRAGASSARSSADLSQVSSLSGRALKQQLEQRLHPCGVRPRSECPERGGRAKHHFSGRGSRAGHVPVWTERESSPCSSESPSTSSLLLDEAYVEEEDLPLLPREDVLAQTDPGTEEESSLSRAALRRRADSPVLLSVTVERPGHRERALQREWRAQCALTDAVEKGYHGVMLGSRRASPPPPAGVNPSIVPDSLEALASLLRNGRSSPANANRWISPETSRQLQQQRGELRRTPHGRRQAALNSLIDTLIQRSTTSLLWQEQHRQQQYRTERDRRSAYSEGAESSAYRARARLALAYRICSLVAPHSRELLLLLMLMSEEECHSTRGTENDSGSVTLAMCAEAMNRILERHAVSRRRERATERLCACIIRYTGHCYRHRQDSPRRRRDRTVEYATFVSSVLELSHAGAG